MAQIPYRANLQSMTFPLLTELSGRTVINPGIDQVFIPGVSPSTENTTVPVDRGFAQIYYCHNVMPSSSGYQSVGFDTDYQGINWGSELPTEVNFKTTALIQGAEVVSSGEDSTVPQATNYKTYISAPKSGPNSVFTLDPVAKNWKLALNAPVLAEDTRITVATVNGLSYIYFSKIGCYVYDNNTNRLEPRELTGLEADTILGILSSNGYLIAYTENAIAWSSVVNVEDFEPSDVSGAGGGQIQEARGQIVTGAVTSLGFILYTTNNAVSVVFSGNADFPWNIKAITSSGGIANAAMISEEQANGFQQAYTTNGLQQIGHTGAKTVLPYITDFIAGQVFEDYDVVAGKFNLVRHNWIMRKGLSVVADRYSIVSYGLYPDGALTHAIVIDLAQNRLGKLRIEHNYSFELRSLLPGVSETPRGSLAFLQADGTIKTVNFNFTAPAPDSVMLLGKYQFVRQRMLEMFMIEFENAQLGADFIIEALPALDGKNFLAEVPGYELERDKNFVKYVFDACVGTNISVLMKGRFNAVSLLLWFGVHGRP